MALINCPECGKQISDKSKACIHCGYPMEDVNSSEISGGDILILNSWSNEIVKKYLWIYHGFPYDYINNLTLENLPIVIDMGRDSIMQGKMKDDIVRLGGVITKKNADDVVQEKIEEYISLGVTNVRIGLEDAMKHCNPQHFHACQFQIRKIIGMTQEEAQEREAVLKRAEQKDAQRRQRQEIPQKETIIYKDRTNTFSAPKEKDASVIGRAVAGNIIAGPIGAVVGALSAIDKNNKNR